MEVSKLFMGIIAGGLALYFIVLAYSIIRDKIKEPFEIASTSDAVINELDKQRRLALVMADISAESQTNQYLPQIDIMKRFKKSTEDMLGSLKDQVYTHTSKKNIEIEDLSKVVRDMEVYAAMDLTNNFEDRKVTKVKSHNNGFELGMHKVDGTTYMVSNKDKCLSVDPDNEYNFIPCNMDDPNQKFKIEYIYNDGQYKNRLDPGFQKLDNLGKVRYPFVYLKSEANKNCVKNSHGYLSVEPCREFVGQRWAPVQSS